MDQSKRKRLACYLKKVSMSQKVQWLSVDEKQSSPNIHETVAISRVFPPLSSVFEVATHDFLRDCGLMRKKGNLMVVREHGWNELILEHMINAELKVFSLNRKRRYIIRVGGPAKISSYWKSKSNARRNPRREGIPPQKYVDEFTRCSFLAGMQKECGPNCEAGISCPNKRIATAQWKKVQVFTTALKGSGLKTLEQIKPHEFIIEYRGKVITKKKNSSPIQGEYIMALDGNMFIDGKNVDSEARYLNHSCEPNCMIEVWDVAGVQRAGLFALMNIRKGQELTIDYRWSSSSSTTKCLCKSKYCRGTIEIPIK
jgi:hypothetical protein